MATAPVADTWVLLEYSWRWEAKALPGAVKLPIELTTWLDGVDARAETRVQLITQPGRRRTGLPLKAFVARPALGSMWSWQVDDYADLPLSELELALDMSGLPDTTGAGGRSSGAGAGGQTSVATHASSQLPPPCAPQIFVCTNGRRDRCCAVHGMAFFLAAHAVVGDRVWQTTHLGGHRFAATALCLPSAHVFGRLEGGDLENLLSAEAGADFAIDKYRGNALLPKPVQAADYFIRQNTPVAEDWEMRASDFSYTAADANRWNVTFSMRRGTARRLGTDSEVVIEGTASERRENKGSASEETASEGTALQALELEVEQYDSEFKVIKTTGDSEASAVTRWRLLSMRTSSSEV